MVKVNKLNFGRAFRRKRAASNIIENNFVTSFVDILH